MYSPRDDKVHPTLERSDRAGAHQDTSLPGSSQYQGSNYPNSGGNPRGEYGTHDCQDDRTLGEKAKDTVGMGPHSHGTTGSYGNAAGYGDTGYATNPSYGSGTTNQGDSSFQPGHETRYGLQGHNRAGGQYGDNNNAYGSRQDDRTMGERAKDMVGVGPHSYGTTGAYDNSSFRNDTSASTSSRGNNSYQPGSDLNSGLERTHIDDNQYGDNTAYGHRQDDRTLGEKTKDTVGMGPHSHDTTGSNDSSRNDNQRTGPYSGTIGTSDNPTGVDNRSNTSTAGSRSTNDTYGYHETGTTSNPSTSTSGTHAKTTGTTAADDSNNNPEHKSFMTSMIDKAKHLVGKGHENDPAHHHHGGRDAAYDNDPNKFGAHNTEYDNDRNKHGKHKGHTKHEQVNENNLFEPSLTNQ